MSQQIENGLKTFMAGEALEAYRRVKLSAGSGSQVEYADVNEPSIGITQVKVGSGEMVTVALRTTGRNDGKVQDTDPGAGTIRGVALEASTADGDIIEAIITA